MHFKVGDTTVQLQGDPSLRKTKISLKSMLSTASQRRRGSISATRLLILM